MDEEVTQNGRGNSNGGEPTSSESSGGRIRHFPQGFSKHNRERTTDTRSGQSEVRINERNSELHEGGKASPPSHDKGNGRYRVGTDGVAEFSSRPAEQSNRRVRNSATNNSNNATGQGHPKRTKIPTTGGSSKINDRELLQEQLVEEDSTPLPSILDLDTQKGLNLSQDVEIIPTRMIEREVLKNQEREVTNENSNEFGMGYSSNPTPEKRNVGRPKKKAGKGSTIKSEDAPTTVEPASYKFDKEVREQLLEVFKYGSKALDLGIDYGLGVDTETLPIWELSDEQADVFVRILERRAARSKTVRDVVVPKLLAGRDYIEAATIVIPKAGATIKAIVDNGGIKPHIGPKKES